MVRSARPGAGPTDSARSVRLLAYKVPARARTNRTTTTRTPRARVRIVRTLQIRYQPTMTIVRREGKPSLPCEIDLRTQNVVQVNDPDRVVPAVDDDQTRDLPGLHDLEGFDGKVVGAHHLGLPRRDVAGSEVLDRAAPEVQAAQIAVSDHPQEGPAGLDDDRHALALFGHLHDRVTQAGAGADDRHRIAGQHEVGYPKQRSPAEGPPRVEHGVVLGSQVTPVQQAHGQGVPQGQ